MKKCKKKEGNENIQRDIKWIIFVLMRSPLPSKSPLYSTKYDGKTKTKIRVYTALGVRGQGSRLPEWLESEVKLDLKKKVWRRETSTSAVKLHPNTWVVFRLHMCRGASKEPSGKKDLEEWKHHRLKILAAAYCKGNEVWNLSTVK